MHNYSERLSSGAAPAVIYKNGSSPKPGDHFLENAMFKRLFLLFSSTILTLSACGTLEIAVERTATPAPSVTPSPEPSIPPTLTPTLPPQQYFKKISRRWRVAFFVESSKQICVVNGEGDDRECLALNVNDDRNFSGPSEPPRGSLALSPNGNKVAYATDCNIYIWTVGEKIVTPLRDESVCGFFGGLKWSPDGNFIAYVSNELHRRCSNCQTYYGDVFVESLDGALVLALTRDLTGHSFDPDWSPDGKNITFAHEPLTLDSQNRVGRRIPTEIYVISLEADIPIDLTMEGKISLAVERNSPINLTNDFREDRRPRWSPDGKRIAFLSDRGEGQTFDLYLMNLEGSGVRIRKAADLALYGWPVSGYPYTWLPDSRFILFHYTLIDTFTGQKEVVTLPYVSVDASWQMVSEDIAIVPSPTPNCASGWSQLSAGIQAVVTSGPNDSPNLVRAAPSSDADILAQIYPGVVVRVFEGPICSGGLVFWNVESEIIPGGVGWIAEGDQVEWPSKYWLEPYNR